MITETYEEHEIILLEEENKWRTTINGRERTFDTIVKAREAIDRSFDPVEKKKKFEPFDAYLARYEKFERVKITSIAEGRGWRSEAQVWIIKDGHREKVGASSLYLINPKNDALIAEIQSLAKQYEEIEKKKDAKIQALKNINLPTS